MTKSRRHRRVQFTELVQFYAGNELLTGRASNLSLGGVAIDCDHPVPTDSDLRIYLPLRFDERRHSRFTAVSGRAVWQNNRRIGVQFDDVPDETAQQLAEYVDIRQYMAV